MANYSRWDDTKNRRRAPSAEVRANIEHDLALGELIHDLRTGAGFSQRELAERMGTPSPSSRVWRKAGAPRTGSTRSPGSHKRSAGT